MISFRKCTTADIDIIRELTFKIWPATYSAILTPEQIEYMLEMMYSETALKEQLQQKRHTFIILYHNDAPAGFASYSVKEPGKTNSYKLHKIYVLPGKQGLGLGKKIVDLIIGDIMPQGAKALELNVNRNNKARGFYESLGFRVIKEEDIDIGNGYFMNDFVMEKVL
ncbi:MAG: GNAT family N-acetyltransferase [Chitinophagaceae bacterium]|nr:GNAT family N-acetyltransferase [Chitinophagaceae bacterium]